MDFKGTMTQYEALCEVFAMACVRWSTGPDPTEKEIRANRIVSQMLTHCKMPDGSSRKNPTSEDD